MSKLPTIIFSALFFAVLAGGLFYSVRDYGQQTNQNITSSLTSRLREAGLAAAGNFQRQLQDRIMVMESLARHFSTHKNLSSRETVAHFASLLLAPGLHRFGILGTDGKGFSALGKAIDLSEEGYFRNALQGHVSIAAAMADSDGERLLGIAVPVFQQGRVRAVLVGGLSAQSLEASLDTGAFENNSYNVVCTAQGLILLGIIPPGESLDELLRHFREEGGSPLSAARLKAFFADGGQDVLYFNEGRRAFYMTQVPLRYNGWHLVSILPQKAVNRFVTGQNRITTTLLWRVAGIAVLLLVYIFITQRRSQDRLRRQQEEYSSIIASISGGVLKINSLTGTFLFVSPNYYMMLGYSREEFEEIYENTFANTIYEEDRETALLTISQQLEAGKPIDVEYRMRAKNGNLIWLYHKGRLVSVDRRQSYIHSIVFDVSHNKEMMQAQRISDERYHFILEQHNIIIFEQDLLSGDFYCSTRWLQLFGSVFNLLEPDPDESLIPVHQDDRQALLAFQQDLQQGKRVAELRLRDAGGQYRWYRIEASNIMDRSGWPIYVIGTITDIDAQKNLELTLRHQATRDSATGMYNKLATEQAIIRSLAALPVQGPGACALFMIDFDNFKLINDRLGHAVGDQAICSMAQIIRRNFGGADIAGRIGGDEFLVFCTEKMPLEQIRQRAQALVRELRTEWGGQGATLALTASVGVACFPGDGLNFRDLYQHADEATYQAKHTGKNSCVFYADMREAGAPLPPAGSSVVNETIDAEADEADSSGTA